MFIRKVPLLHTSQQTDKEQQLHDFMQDGALYLYKNYRTFNNQCWTRQ
jgi:hypothetical protein